MKTVQMTFITHAAPTPIRAFLIVRSANNDDILVVPYGGLHELWQLISRNKIPLVKSYEDTVAIKAGGEIVNPLLVVIVVPGVRKKYCRYWYFTHSLITE